MSGSLKRLKVARKKGMKMGTFYVHNVRRGKFFYVGLYVFIVVMEKLGGLTLMGDRLKMLVNL